MGRFTTNKDVHKKLVTFLQDESNRAIALGATQSSESGLFTTISKWLGKLLLLYGVPFEYLIPSEKMLPNESLRFFYIDPNWLERLVDGALSISPNNQTIENLLYQAMAQDFIQAAVKEAGKIRPETLGKEASETTNNFGWTGFLMRSKLVSAWRGLDFYFNPVDGKSSLNILRMEQLSDDVLLAIVDGDINELQIKQPPEGFFFGAEEQNGVFNKQFLRLLAPSQGKPIGTAVPLKQCLKIATRGGNSRVIDVQTMSDQFQKNKSINPKQVAFTSAEFALQMVFTPAEITIDTPAQLDSKAALVKNKKGTNSSEQKH
tara:strand:- start:59349 stop:60302 length:954 start_codon:yes stop_codon:yes gene_type:complete